MARPLIETLVPGCTWGLPEHEPIWTRVMQDVVNAQSDAGGFRAVLTLARVPALIALYAGGLAAFHRGQYGTLRAVGIDPRYRGSRDRPTPLLGAAGPTWFLSRSKSYRTFWCSTRTANPATTQCKRS